MGTGNINIWFLEVHNLQADGKTYTGTTRSCKTTLPDVTLSALAMLVITNGTKIQIAITDQTFDAITRTFASAGMEGAPGGMVTQSPTLGGLGLVDGSPYVTLPTPKAWPADCSGAMCNSAGSFMVADLQDDDHDSSQGITATPQTGNGYVSPPADIGNSAQVDKVYIALRQELEVVSGMRSADGKSASGTVKLSLFDNHVVGCHISGGADCNSTQAGFVDTNRTKYTTASNSTISPSNSVMGTFSSQQLTNGAKCSDVRTALP
jgi:hypothetical protein